MWVVLIIAYNLFPLFLNSFYLSTPVQTSEIHYTNKKVQIAEKPLTPNNNLSTTTTKTYSSEPEEKSKALVGSKNITGPPVYYPPNHELFAAKEEAAYRASVNNWTSWKLSWFILIIILLKFQGGYAKGRGKYEYEAASKSKSSSKSGAAVVPLW